MRPTSVRVLAGGDGLCTILTTAFVLSRPIESLDAFEAWSPASYFCDDEQSEHADMPSTWTKLP